MKGRFEPAMGWAARSAIGGLLLLAGMPVCAAQDTGEFYRGRTVRILVGSAPGGDYDAQARLMSRHLGRHLPGEPTVIVENMTGAGGMNMANYLYTLAAKDGTAIGVMPNNFPSLQWAEGRGIQFDVAQFGWLGSLTQETQTILAWHTSGVKTLEDAKRSEVVVGSTGRGTFTYAYPAMFNALIGTKFKIVSGYPGGNDINLAMEREEVVARNNSWTAMKSTRPEWVRNGWINVLVQGGARHPDLATVPSVETMARSPEDRQLIDLANLGSGLGRPFTAPPGLPTERLAALRDGLRKASVDSKLLAEAAQMGMEPTPLRAKKCRTRLVACSRRRNHSCRAPRNFSNRAR
jgi:tripartite-type tricarboxylate transporter receptor subunit TctC